MSVDKTYFPKAKDLAPEWFLVDANGQNLGRVATRITRILLGKDKPIFTPGMDTGDFVIVVNCEKITVTGNKMEEKQYHSYSGYPSGLKSISLRQQLVKHPDRVIRAAVWGMLPHNKYGRQVIKKLHIYKGPEHPHQAQQPKPVEN